MPKWLVYGEEPYLIDKFRKKIIDEVETPEFNRRRVNLRKQSRTSYVSMRYSGIRRC